MTVIAWDGKTLAADRQGTCAGMRYRATKLRRIGKEALAICGDHDYGTALMEWYERGATPETWPSFQKTGDWVRLIVASRGRCFHYEREPKKLRVLDRFMAWGSGRDYAMGAMATGVDARRAVLVASRFDNGCGLGVDVVSF